MSDTDLVKTIIVTASREAVWAHLTDKEKLGTWYHPARADLAAGTDYELHDAGDGTAKIWGRVLEWDPPGLLVTTFCIPPFGEAETVLTWELTDIGGATRVKLRHSGIAKAAGEAAIPMLAALDAGWDAHLGDLRKGAG